MIRSNRRLGYAGREYSASLAAGYLSVHLEQQRALVESALGLDELAASSARPDEAAPRTDEAREQDRGRGLRPLNNTHASPTVRPQTPNP